MEKLPSNVVHLPTTLKHMENIDLLPKTSKNQIGMLKTFEIKDSKPNGKKKFFHTKNV